MKFKRKPTTINAVQWTGTNADEIRMFADRPDLVCNAFDDSMSIPTPEGTLCVKRGDWVILGHKGSLLVCDDTTFSEEYEKDTTTT